VKRVLAHYESQSDEEEVAKDEAVGSSSSRLASRRLHSLRISACQCSASTSLSAESAASPPRLHGSSL
jgi:hypothetical protein